MYTSTDKTTCTLTSKENNCFYSILIKTGSVEQEDCQACENGSTIELKEYCTDGGTDLSTCLKGTYHRCVKSDHFLDDCIAVTAWGLDWFDSADEGSGVNPAMKCKTCKNGYVRDEATGLCVKAGDEFNASCVKKVGRGDPCDLCEYNNRYYAVGADSGGKQLCFKSFGRVLEVLRLFGGLYGWLVILILYFLHLPLL